MGGPPIDGELVSPEAIVTVEIVERAPGDELRYVSAGASPQPR
jgi:hypothetical protein